MQEGLFDDLLPAPEPAPRRRQGAAPADHARPAGPGPAAPPARLLEVAAQLPPLLRMGGSTWSYPGWEDLVWDGPYEPSVLAKKGLTAYAQHPLLRTVCIDRSFWRPLSVSQYAAYAGQTPADFRPGVNG